MFKDVSNTLENFTFMGTTICEIAVGSGLPPFLPPPPLVKGMGTEWLGKEMVEKTGLKIYFFTDKISLESGVTQSTNCMANQECDVLLFVLCHKR